MMGCLNTFLTVASAALLALGAGRAIAAPANDAFSARLPLGSSPSVAASGTTVAATLEPDENDLDLIGGASVWWKWTAPATTWVTVDTDGSAIDTVLAVMADGPTLDDAYVVGFNDESGDPEVSLGSSRLVFQATAGTEYHLAVHGFLGAQGAVALKIRSGVTPPIRLRSLALSPSSVIVTSASAEVVVDLGIDTEADFVEGVLVVHRSDFLGVAEIPILPAQRISGTPRAGVYRVVVPVARYAPAGTWLLEVAASDTLGREAVFGRGVSAGFEYDHAMPNDTTGHFGVTNSGPVDDTAPVLASFERSPAALDVTSVPGSLQFTFRVVDALSGFGGATLTLFTPTGEALTALAVTSAHRTAGTGLDGTYHVSFQLPARMPSGVWTTSLLLRDATGSPALYDGAVTGEDFPLGASSAEVAVTGAPHAYYAWLYPLTAATAGAGPNEDFDADGLSNLVEFAFGLSVSSDDNGPGSASLPSTSFAADTLTMSFLRRRAGVDGGLLYRPQFSNDIARSGPGAWVDAAAGAVEVIDGTWERVRVPAPGGSRRFGRVHVALP